MSEVSADHVVMLTFVVVEVDGEVLDDAWATEPYAYIHGKGQMPIGFEQGIDGLEEGDTFDFDVPSELAYGKHNNQMVQKIESSQLPPGLKPGMVIQMELPGHPTDAPPLIFHVKSISDEGIVRLDGNHPFAGKDLRFMGKVRGVRLALARELETGRIRRDS